MNKPNPSLVPDESLSRDEMVSLQHEIAGSAVFEDNLGRVKTVAGVDQAFVGDAEGEMTVSAAVAVQNGEETETATARHETRLPYIPGLLSFREGRAVIASLRALETTLDVVLVDGSGRIHPRQAGLATHVGVALDLPTVGVAKSLLCGTPRRSVDGLEEDECVEIVADDGVDAPDGTTIGYAVQTKQYSKDAATTVNPLYVSPGHLVSPETAVDIVAKECDGYKLPEPVRRADAIAGEVS
jgi:deoxyribonuclease V